MPGATLEVLLQCLSPLKAWLQAQTTEGTCQALDTTLLCPLVSPHHGTASAGPALQTCACPG